MADPGVSVGYTQRTYVVTGKSPVEERTYYGHIPTPIERLVGMNSVVLGLDVDMTNQNGGIVLGYQNHQLYSRAGLNSNFSIRYESNEEGQRRIYYLEGPGNE
jgi:hypothetical protein